MKLIIGMLFLVIFSEAFAANCISSEAESASLGVDIKFLYGNTTEAYNKMLSLNTAGAPAKDVCDAARETRENAAATESSLLLLQQSFQEIEKLCPDHDQEAAQKSMPGAISMYNDVSRLDHNLQIFLLKNCSNN